MKESWFVTRIGDARYGLEMNHVDEVIRAAKLVRIPQAPSALAGALVLRGQAIPILDFRERLGAAPKALDPSQFFVIGTIAAVRGGLVVDFVEGMTELELDPDAQKDLPHPEYAVGLGQDAQQRPVVLLDLAKILRSEDATRITAAVEQLAEQAEAPDAQR